MPTTPARTGDTDALVRQTRGVMRLLTDPDSDRDRRTLYFAIVADNFERLDRLLSAGAPLPEMWRGKHVAGDAANRPGAETPECEKTSVENGEK